MIWNNMEILTSLIWFRYSFICHGTSTRRQQSDLFGLRVKLSHNKQTCRPISTLTILNVERQAGKL